MVTMKDIAKKAGVSLGTVHRVINRKGYFSLESKKKVEQAITELKYQPNMFARNLKLSKKYTFGILIPDKLQDDGFWNLYIEGIKLAKKTINYKNINLKFFYFDRYSFISFSIACEKILNAKLDGIILTPVLSNVSEEFIKRISQKVPYVFIDTHIPNTDCLTSITQDSYISGRLAGKLMHTKINSEGIVAVIKLIPPSLQINERVKGIYDYFKNNASNIELVTYEAFRDDPNQNIHDIVKSTLNSVSNIKGIIVSNTLTHRVASTVKEMKLDRKVPVIGFNLLVQNIKYLKEGYIEFLINEKPEIQGYKSLFAMYRHVVLNEPIPNSFRMTIDILTAEHIDYYMKHYMNNFIPS